MSFPVQPPPGFFIDDEPLPPADFPESFDNPFEEPYDTTKGARIPGYGHLIKHPTWEHDELLRHVDMQGGAMVLRKLPDADDGTPTDPTPFGTVPEWIPSRVGVLFDRYVKEVLREPSAYSPTGPAKKEFPRLWPERKLRIAFQKELWIPGCVKTFSQACAGPLSPCTLWYATIQLNLPSDSENLPLGTLVELSGLKSATGKKLNGHYGVVIAGINDEGRYGVKLAANQAHRFRATNLKAVQVITRGVGRMNVVGGGVLIGADNDPVQTFSLEWTEASDPPFDPWSIVEDIDEAQKYQLTMNAQDDDIQEEKLRLKDAFAEHIPDRLTTRRTRLAAFEHFYDREYGPEFLRLAKDDLRGFEYMLMTQSHGIFCCIPQYLKKLQQGGQIDALKVFASFVEHRWQTGEAEKDVLWSLEVHGMDHLPNYSTAQDAVERELRGYIEVQYHVDVADALRSIGDHYFFKQYQYGKSLPWYLEALEYGKRGYSEHTDMTVRRLHHDVAENYRSLGNLPKAMNFYDAGINTYGPTPIMAAAREKLRKELNLWKGTSGNVPRFE